MRHGKCGLQRKDKRKREKRLNTKLEILGILITMVNSQTVFGKEITDLINLVYGSHIRIFENQIPRTVRVEECSADGVSIYKHAGNCSAAKAYEAVAGDCLVLPVPEHRGRC